MAAVSHHHVPGSMARSRIRIGIPDIVNVPEQEPASPPAQPPIISRQCQATHEIRSQGRPAHSARPTIEASGFQLPAMSMSYGSHHHNTPHAVHSNSDAYRRLPESSSPSSASSQASSHPQLHFPNSSPLPAHHPRPPRPAYSDEQKFYIMFARIARDLEWTDIERRFAVLFGPRSRGGLTSVYYRVRKEWRLREVQKNGPEYLPSDVKEVDRRAGRFSREYLLGIGYLIK